MFAHFETNNSFVEEDLMYRLNSILPKDIAILSLFKVNAKAHARFDAVSRTYLYRISLHKNVFTFEKSFFVKQKLDVLKMNEAAQFLLQYKDFQCFSKSNTDVKTYHCNIMFANWKIVNGELQFTIKADRFLRNMVRAIVGTLINIGLNKMEVNFMHEIIKSKDRGEAGFSVPAHALYLQNVEYLESLKYNE
ncbi:UNVERIFIED_CONTAM: hypothetical protein GTU68_031965 [Idotea baltica]|nr:hypothetical protein [Idotea baltica]